MLDGALYTGPTGNAAALGSMPISMPGRGEPPQLIACASFFQLERRLEAAGLDPSSMWRTPDAWDDYGAPSSNGSRKPRYALAQASVSAMSVIDVAAIVIDGAMPDSVRQQFSHRVAAQIETLDRRGLSD